MKKKVLLYVDAENLNVDDLKTQLSGIRQSLTEDEDLQGKFYGGIKVLGNITNVCYCAGLEYVETSSLLQGQKNVTDIKLIIDCMQDVFENRQSISRVILLSHDCDFTPLVYKLRSWDVTVLAPLFSIYERSLNTTDVEKELKKLDFHQGYIDEDLTYFNNCFCEMRQLLPERFSDDLLHVLLDKKKKSFLKSIKPLCSTEDFTALTGIPADQFTFFDVLERCHFEGQILVNAVKQYTAKFYGFLFSNKDLATVISKLEQKYQ